MAPKLPAIPSIRFGLRLAGRSISTSQELTIADWNHRLKAPVQTYLSLSDDPVLNLSLENYMLQNASHDSVVLFLYTNRPSVIIGRNQNPWLEVNIRDLYATPTAGADKGTNVDLVRRRSGGGTVYHDHGNINWSVISPSTTFTRDKHAAMVVRALRNKGVSRARVNERHDIVLDPGKYAAGSGKITEYNTRFTMPKNETIKPLKISGSAYKLIRNRALHHGTCLLANADLSNVGHYLRSPAKEYISARGVESVSSPVGSVNLSTEEFVKTVEETFCTMYSNGTSQDTKLLGVNLASQEAVQRGCNELRSPEWTFAQTPQFTIKVPSSRGQGTLLELTVQHGVITTSRWQSEGPSDPIDSALIEDLAGKRLHEIESWSQVMTATSAILGVSLASELSSTLELLAPTLSTRVRRGQIC